MAPRESASRSLLPKRLPGYFTIRTVAALSSPRGGSPQIRDVSTVLDQNSQYSSRAGLTASQRNVCAAVATGACDDVPIGAECTREATRVVVLADGSLRRAMRYWLSSGSSRRPLKKIADFQPSRVDGSAWRASLRAAGRPTGLINRPHPTRGRASFATYRGRQLL